MNAVVEVIDGGNGRRRPGRGHRLSQPGRASLGRHRFSLMAAANALLGNAPDAAVLEVGLAGPALKALSGVLRISLAGNLGAGGHQPRAARKNPALADSDTPPGDTARIGANGGGASPSDCPAALTCRASWGAVPPMPAPPSGGIGGRYLAAGDRLACQVLSGDPGWNPAAVATAGEGALRVILGPRTTISPPPPCRTFSAAPGGVTRDMDRMGLRLRPSSWPTQPEGADIVSDGVVPGSIQVPANRQPSCCSPTPRLPAATPRSPR